MTVAILADSPTLTTGFARTTARIAGALSTRYEVSCFGIKAAPSDVADTGLPYAVWPAVQGGRWTRTLRDFFTWTRPEVLVLNMDAFNAVECLGACRHAGWTGPTVSYVCFDGLPVGRAYLAAQRSCAAVWATSPIAAAYLLSERVDVAGVAPPGVSAEEFAPLANRDAIRESLDLTSAFLVGVFATNTARKQLPRALEGFAHAVQQLPDANLRLYLHTQARAYWDLVELLERLGIAERTVIADVGCYGESRRVGMRAAGREAAWLNSLEYADRLGLCDLAVNTPYSGDVEQVILEAGACAVPLLHTDDEAIMKEAVGEGGILLPAVDVALGQLGERHHHVDPLVLGEQISRLVDDATARGDLARRGVRNAARFPWAALEKGALAMVEPYATAGTPT